MISRIEQAREKSQSAVISWLYQGPVSYLINLALLWFNANKTYR